MRKALMLMMAVLGTTVVPGIAAAQVTVIRSDSMAHALGRSEVLGALACHCVPADLAATVFRVRFNLPLDDGRVADTEISFSVASLLRREHRGVFMVPGSIGPLEFYDSGVDGFDAGVILAQAGFIAATSDLPGDGASSGPPNGRTVDAAFLGDFYLRTVHALTTLGIRRWDVYGEEGTGGNTILLLAQHPDVVRTASSGANIYQILTPAGEAALLSPQQLGFLDSFPNGYLFPPGFLYAPFFQFSTPEFQTAACGGVGCPGPGGFLLTDGPYPSGIFFDAITAFSPGGPGIVVDPAAAAVPGFIEQGQFDFFAVSPDDSNALVARYGVTGGGHATNVICANGFHFVRTDAGSGDGPGSCFWTNELAFLNAH